MDEKLKAVGDFHSNLVSILRDALEVEPYRRQLRERELEHARKLAEISARDPVSHGGFETTSALRQEVFSAFAANPQWLAAKRSRSSPIGPEVCSWIDNHWPGQPFYPPELSLTAVWRKGGKAKSSLKTIICQVRAAVVKKHQKAG